MCRRPGRERCTGHGTAARKGRPPAPSPLQQRRHRGAAGRDLSPTGQHRRRRRRGGGAAGGGVHVCGHGHGHWRGRKRGARTARGGGVRRRRCCGGGRGGGGRAAGGGAPAREHHGGELLLRGGAGACRLPAAASAVVQHWSGGASLLRGVAQGLGDEAQNDGVAAPTPGSVLAQAHTRLLSGLVGQQRGAPLDVTAGSAHRAIGQQVGPNTALDLGMLLGGAGSDPLLQTRDSLHEPRDSLHPPRDSSSHPMARVRLAAENNSVLQEAAKAANQVWCETREARGQQEPWADCLPAAALHGRGPCPRIRLCTAPSGGAGGGAGPGLLRHGLRR